MSSTRTIQLDVGGVPPSVNQMRGWHWSKIARTKRMWQDWLSLDLYRVLGPVVTPFKKVHATAELHFPVKRRRDEGNFRAQLEKSLGDALTERGYLADDTPEHFTFGAITFGKGAQRTLVTLKITDHL